MVSCARCLSQHYAMNLYSTVSFVTFAAIHQEKSPHWFCQMFVKQTKQFRTFVQACSFAFAMIVRTVLYCTLTQLCKHILSVVRQFFCLLHAVQSSLYGSVSAFSITLRYVSRQHNSCHVIWCHLLKHIFVLRAVICFFLHRAS